MGGSGNFRKIPKIFFYFFEPLPKWNENINTTNHKFFTSVLGQDVSSSEGWLHLLQFNTFGVLVCFILYLFCFEFLELKLAIDIDRVIPVKPVIISPRCYSLCPAREVLTHQNNDTGNDEKNDVYPVTIPQVVQLSPDLKNYILWWRNLLYQKLPRK